MARGSPLSGGPVSPSTSPQPVPSLPFVRPFLAFALLALGALLPCFASAQTIAITEGVQTYGSLSGATVTLTGKSELRLTAASAALTGSVVNLNSLDSALLFTNVRPSTVASAYLGQIRVNGAAAVSGTNVRIVQYGAGAIILPHTQGLAPLQVFTGPDFSGSSRDIPQYRTYNSSGTLGAFDRTISSLRLRRGYMATVSTQTDGTGPSRLYIAQDGDLEIGRLPAELDNAIAFIRVLPWRWVSKKGACDIAPTTLDASWFYNWNNDGNVVQSTLDHEFVPIRQQRWWPAYPTNKPESNHLLGFNEPNNPVEDAYTSLDNGNVDTAIAVWPELLAVGLRVGAPAVTDGGETWLYDFMAKADAARLRVDYVPIHFYRCGYSASQLYAWLYNIHVRTGRPLWVTEFNNGANWTTCADPTLEQNATTIAAFTEMLDNAPFIERYAIYSAVEPVRQMVDSNGALTPAGTAYKANASPIGYTQRLPAAGSRAAAQFSFDGTTLDNAGLGNHAIGAGRPAFTAGRTGQAVRLDGSTTHLQLPPDVANATAFTFAAWVRWDGGAVWQRIFDFGRDTTHYMFLTPAAGSGTLRFAINNGSGEQLVESAGLASGQWQHVAVTLSGGVARLYRNGSLAASAAVSITPAQLAADLNYLGKSQFSADPLFAGRLDDVLILDRALGATQIAALQTNTAPAFSAATLPDGTATQGVAYTGSLAGSATDPDAGDTLSYGKVAGPAWLQVAPGGALSGTPTFDEEGTQEFVLTVTDAAGATDSIVLKLTLPLVMGSGVWNTDASGSWGTTTNWTAAFPANGRGRNADFSTVNLSTDRTVTLDAARTLGGLVFGDTTGSENQTIATTAGAALTLNTGTSSAPSIQVKQNTATLNLPLAGSSGLVKDGAGALVLGAVNPLSGNITLNAGTLAVIGSAALFPGGWNNTAVVTVNAGATLELDRWGYGPGGTYRTQALGGLDYAPARLVLNGGKLRYTGGTAGAPLDPAELPYGPGFTIGAGGATLEAAKADDTWTVKNDSRGVGVIASASAGTLILAGAGNGVLEKVIPGAGGLLKTGAGTWTLPLANTYSGPTAVNGGTLRVTGSLAGGAVSVGSGATLEGTGVVGGALTLQSGARLAPGAGGVGRLIATGGVTFLAGAAARFELNKTAASRDSLAVTGALVLAGTLEVSNLAGTLALGDSFDLFDATTCSGSFSTFSLPVLPAGLAWDTSALTAFGVIRVVAAADYAAWAAGLPFPVGQSDLTLDPDGDGLANAFEWLFEGNPLAADSASRRPGALARTVTTAEFPGAAADKTYLTMTARIRKNHPGLSLVPQAASALHLLDAAEAATPVTSFVVADEAGFETRTWIYTTALQDSATGCGFMRLKLVAE